MTLNEITELCFLLKSVQLTDITRHLLLQVTATKLRDDMFQEAIVEVVPVVAQFVPHLLHGRTTWQVMLTMFVDQLSSMLQLCPLTEI